MSRPAKPQEPDMAYSKETIALMTRDGEYPWECSCGECFKSATKALICSKCDRYLMPGTKKEAVNLFTGERVDWSNRKG